jgi:hypothetical protein
MPEQQNIQPTEVQPKEVEKDVFVWSAPSRPFVQKTREFWVKVIAIASIFGFIIFIVEGAMPVLLMIALIFLFYILSTVRPENIDYKITNLGTKIGDVTTHWEEIKRFWFSKRGNDEILVLDLATFTGRLELVINIKDKDKIRQTLKKTVPEEEALQTGIDKASEWVGSKLS